MCNIRHYLWHLTFRSNIQPLIARIGFTGILLKLQPGDILLALHKTFLNRETARLALPKGLRKVWTSELQWCVVWPTQAQGPSGPLERTIEKHPVTMKGALTVAEAKQPYSVLPSRAYGHVFRCTSYRCRLLLPVFNAARSSRSLWKNKKPSSVNHIYSRHAFKA